MIYAIYYVYDMDEPKQTKQNKHVYCIVLQHYTEVEIKGIKKGIRNRLNRLVLQALLLFYILNSPEGYCV